MANGSTKGGSGSRLKSTTKAKRRKPKYISRAEAGTPF